jgi:hypothetical protein
MDKRAQVTAGLRGALWSAERAPVAARTTLHSLPTLDSATTLGVLYSLGDERTVACIMHPREFVAQHYLVPELLDAGVAVWVQAPRAAGSDLRLEHENSVLEVAAGCAHLRERGFERIVLVGTSGGGPMYALYNQQSLLDPPRRLETTPSGRPTRLQGASLPNVDGFVFVSAHLGQGAILLAGIDGSLTDESDPFSVEQSLSPFAEVNGFAPPPLSARYSEAFASRYRAAQAARVARIDRMAREDVAERTDARKKLRAGADPSVAARAAYARIFTIWRTDADLRNFDLNLDPSERRYGSLWGSNPAVSNYGSVAFARICTAESWLSSWSANATNASMERCAPAIEQPTLYVHFTGDNCVFPADADKITGWIGASDKSFIKIHGDHQGQSLGPDYPDPRSQLGAELRHWLAPRFPTRART